MSWYYEADPAWLEARKGFLCATEMAGLVSLWQGYQESAIKAQTDKRYKPESKLRDFKDKAVAIWRGKQRYYTEDYTTDAMRRGHCEEPYAIADWAQNTGQRMFHWDNILVANGKLAASPDGLDIAQPQELTVFYNELGILGARHGVEVKCFNPDAHMEFIKNGFATHPDILAQIAVQIHVCGLEDVTLILYNPNMSGELTNYGLFDFVVRREDVAEITAMFPTIIDEYEKAVNEYRESLPASRFTVHFTEGQIKQECGA